MRTSTSAQLLALGPELAPAMLQGTSALMAAAAAPIDPAVERCLDLAYGPDERHRLDLFRKGQPRGAPVLVFVHGGGFVMGNKSAPGSPFYGNIGQWAAQHGYVGVALTYRLAPQHRWPSGPQDMALAVRWLRDHVAAYGGDPEAIVLMGQSAGATHVAGYLSHPQFHVEAGGGIAGAVLVSGVYDPVTQPDSPSLAAYYGEDAATRAGARCTQGMLASSVPLLLTVSEYDGREFQDQALQFAQAWHQHRGGYPPMEYLAGHNHLTPAQAIGSPDDDLGPRISAFIARACQR